MTNFKKNLANKMNKTKSFVKDNMKFVSNKSSKLVEKVKANKKKSIILLVLLLLSLLAIGLITFAVLNKSNNKEDAHNRTVSSSLENKTKGKTSKDADKDSVKKSEDADKDEKKAENSEANSEDNKEAKDAANKESQNSNSNAHSNQNAANTNNNARVNNNSNNTANNTQAPARHSAPASAPARNQSNASTNSAPKCYDKKVVVANHPAQYEDVQVMVSPARTEPIYTWGIMAHGKKLGDKFFPADAADAVGNWIVNQNDGYGWYETYQMKTGEKQIPATYRTEKRLVKGAWTEYKTERVCQ